MEHVLKILSRFVQTSTPRVSGNWVTLVFPAHAPPTKLGRWRNVKKGLSDCEVPDPAYDAPAIVRAELGRRSEADCVMDMCKSRFFV